MESREPGEPDPKIPRQLADADLIGRARAGDDDAFGLLYERHVHSARRLARHYAAAPADVDDIVSEAFARVLRIIHAGGGPRESFRMYVLTVVRRIAAHTAQERKRTTSTAEPETFTAPIPFEDPVVAELESSMVARAFAALPERWRTVLWHTEVEGESPARVAPQLGLSANGAAALAFRAREGLRTAYVQEHLSVSGAEGECRGCASNLAPYLRGTISARARRRVEEHLASCDRCRLLLAELSEVSGSLRGVLGPIVLGPVATAYWASRAHSSSGSAGNGAGSPAAGHKGGRSGRMTGRTGLAMSGTAAVASLAVCSCALAAGAFFLMRPASSTLTDMAGLPSSGTPLPTAASVSPSGSPTASPSASVPSPSLSGPSGGTPSDITATRTKAPTPRPSLTSHSPGVTKSPVPTPDPKPLPDPVLSDVGFEAPPISGLYSTYAAGTSIGGWKVVQNTVNIHSSSSWPAAEGNQSVDLNGDPPAPTAGAIAQSFDTVAGQAYTLTFYLAGNPCAPAVKTLRVDVGGTTRDLSFDTTGHSTLSMGWRPENVRFTAGGKQTTLRFISTTDPTSACGPVIDGIHVHAG